MKVVTGQTTITTIKNYFKIFIVQSVSLIAFYNATKLFGIIFTNYFKQINISVNFTVLLKSWNL